MTTTMRELINAANSIHVLTGQALPFSAARQVRSLHTRLVQETATAAECQQELMQKYGGTAEESGQIRFVSRENAAAFHVEWEKQATEVIAVADWEKIDLRSVADSLVLSAEQLADLEPFVQFE